MVERLVSFAANLTVLSVLTMTAEFLVPEGKLKRTVCAATGLVFFSAAVEQILGIFAGMGG